MKGLVPIVTIGTMGTIKGGKDMEWFVLFSLLAVGYVVGLMQNGIKITINHKHPEAVHQLQQVQQEPQSTEDMLPKDMQDYMKQHNGFMNV